MSERLQYNPAEAFSTSLSKNLDIAKRGHRSGRKDVHRDGKKEKSGAKSDKVHESGKSYTENSQSDVILYKFKKDIMDELRSINKRLDSLERKQVDVKDVQKSVADIQKQMVLNEFTIGADDDLKNYLMAEKDNDMTESALTGGDIARGADKINAKRRNRR